MDFSDNLKYYRLRKGITQRELATEIGTNNTTLSNWEKGISKPDIDTIIKLSNYFGISIDELIFSKPQHEDGKNGNLNGNPEGKKNAYLNAYPDAYLTEKNSPKDDHLNDHLNDHLKAYPDKKNTHIHLIPFYDAIAVAGRMSGANMEAVTVPAEMINPGDWYMDATCAMRVYDESMIPEYRPGSVVALKEVYDKRLIIPGEDYVIETPEYRVIKRLQKADDKTCWLACSVNQEIWEQGPHKGKLIHEPFEIPINLVRRVFLVLGEIRRKQCGNIFYT